MLKKTFFLANIMLFLCFFLQEAAYAAEAKNFVTQALFLLQKKRDQKAITERRADNPVWKNLHNATVIIIKKNGPALFTYEKINQTPHDVLNHRLQFNLLQEYLSCIKQSWHPAYYSTVGTAVTLRQGLCHALELKAPEDFLHRIITRLYAKNTCDNTRTIDHEDIGNNDPYGGYTSEYETNTYSHHYTCSLLHVSALRFAYMPTAQSRDLFIHLITADPRLNTYDATEIHTQFLHNSSRLPVAPDPATPLELLTDTELHSLIQDTINEGKTVY